MKKIIVFISTCFMLQLPGMAQLSTTPNGGNKKAMVGERIGLTDVTIHYNRPALKGRAGKIWGELVPFGFTDLGFGTSKAAPWRAGANENTSIEFSTDVMINDQPLPAGKYGFFIATGKEESTLIFSKDNAAWGSYFYDPARDALRISSRQQVLDKPVEVLEFVFQDQTANAASISLQWENWKFPFTVATDLNSIQASSFRNELKSAKGFEWQAWVQAASWSADNNTNLAEGLQWADYAIAGPFVGEKNFTTLSAKAKILNKMGKGAEATALMQEATAMGSVAEVHNYARSLLAAGKATEAAAVYKANYKKYPNVFTSNMGMVRALSSEGKYKDALKYANAALAQAPDEANKKNLVAMIEKLKKGESVN